MKCQSYQQTMGQPISIPVLAAPVIAKPGFVQGLIHDAR